MQRAVFNDTLWVTGYQRSTHLNGDATRFDLERVIFRGEESVLLVGADVRRLQARLRRQASTGSALVL